MEKCLFAANLQIVSDKTCPTPLFLAPFSPPSRHRCGHTLCRTTQTSRFPAQNPLPGEKWQFYSENLGGKLQKKILVSAKNIW